MAVDASTSARGDLILKNLTKSFGEFNAVDDLSLVIPKGSFFALLGPSGCGKSSFLRCINRMNDTIDSCRIEGEIRIDNQNI